MDIKEMTALEIGAAIKSGLMTCADATGQLLDYIEKTDSRINAYITLCREKALERARQIDLHPTQSPLCGVPVAVKDNICTKGLKTTCASKMLENFVPVYHATVIDRLEKAGMVVIGKLNMDEFAMGSTNETSCYGAVKNPFNTECVSGGSSGGGAAAIASGEAVCALGSDSGGSIRLPASYCGITGFKPTYGAVSRYGLIAYASCLDQIGPMAKDVADCAALCDIIMGRDPMDSTSAEIDFSCLNQLNPDISGMKFAVPEEFFDSNRTDSRVAACVRDMIGTLQLLGAQVSRINLPYLDYTIPAYYLLSTAQASSNLARFDGVKYGVRSKEAKSIDRLYSFSRAQGFGDEVVKRIMLGTFVLSEGYYDAYYLKALKVRSLIKQSYDQLFERYDAVVCPTAPTTAPALGKLENVNRADIFTAQANLAGLPALSVPCGFDDHQMPIGAQIIGKAFDDAKVLSIGYAYQQHTDFHKSKAEVVGV